ncbi:hypothetical protein [Telluribacter humicola]
MTAAVPWVFADVVKRPTSSSSSIIRPYSREALISTIRKEIMP